jgi:hypothetical protein
MENIAKLCNLSTYSFINNHIVEIFGPSVAISNLRQIIAIGYNRTDTQREKIAEYGKQRFENAYKLGLVPSPTPENDPRFDAEKIAQVLRDRHGIKNIGNTITVSR